jgi:hypothetical protein
MKRVLAVAVRDTLRADLALQDHECNLQPGGRPPPVGWADYYVAVHSGGQQNSARESLDRTFDVQVTVTYRVGKVPVDRRGPSVLQKAEFGLEDLCEKIIRLLHNNHQLRIASNDLISDSGLAGSNTGVNYGIQEALIFLHDDGEAHEVSGEWFHAKSTGETAGLVQVLTFGEARRLESIPSLRDVG